MESASPFPYRGPDALHAPIVAALERVVDPEVAMNIVDVGLVYGVEVDATRLKVTLTMTSAACPVADMIVGEVESELERIVLGELTVDVELVWDPPWSAERMSERAKSFMGW